jgi:hypothetical protein
MPAASRLVGRGLSEVIRLVQWFRPGRPVHPHGISLIGGLTRLGAGSGSGSGIAWLDQPGAGEVTARLSRGLGLPELLPDIIGLALRVADEEGLSDVLLASTGLSRPSRFLVLLRRRVDKATLGSLMPYKGSRGPVLLAARTVAPPVRLPASIEGFRRALGNEAWRLGLYWARPWGPWIRFGTLELRLDPQKVDSADRHDPMLNAPRGALTYDWARNLRERSYRLARRLKVRDRRR